MQIKKSLVIIGLTALLLIPLASAGFFNFITGKATGANTNVTAEIVSTQATVITSVRFVSPLTLQENTTVVDVINFTASDLDGSNDINMGSGVVNVSKVCGGSTVARISSSCTNTTPSGLAIIDVNFTCPVTLQYYDCVGSWNVNASINYTHGIVVAKAYNDSTSLSINALQAVYISPLSVAFNPLAAFDTDQNSTTDNYVTNTGNQVPNIELTAVDLHGQTNSSIIFPANNFTSLSLNSTHTLTSNFCANGVQLVNATPSTIATTAGPVGDRPLVNRDGGNAGSTTEIKYCIPSVPQLFSQNYTTDFAGSWVISATTFV